MKKTIAVIALLLAAVFALTACVSQSDNGNSQTGNTSVSSDGQTQSQDISSGALEDPADSTKESTDDFTITAVEGGGEVEHSGSVYTVKYAGEYELSGKIENGQIIVDAGDDDEVTLTLKDASISCSDNAPITVLNAGEVTVTASKDSYNVIRDNRGSSFGESDYDAAIYSDCDLKLNGHGTLIVETEYDNGVKSKDDLSIKNLTLKVTAYGNALKGNDSVTIKSGDIILISTSSDGIKTENTDVSSKGNQRGTISIEGGHVDVYSACDGLSAAYNAEISQSTEEDAQETVVNIYTSTYSENSESISKASDLYLILASSVYSESNGYYAYFYNEDDTAGVWKECTMETMVSSGRTYYYGLVVSVPSGYQNVLFNILPSGTTPDGTNYTASSGGEVLNTSMNGYLVTSVSSGTFSGDWVQLTSGSGNSNKSTYSSKGIKAYNEINISGGVITVYCMDDGLHANADGTLENGSSATGNVNITGGTVTITAADDGIHADGELKIDNGYVNIADSHEGLEGNVITVNGGTVYVYGDDDGMNACKGSQSTVININGGYVEVTTPSGDTDAIDSNGSFKMTGGLVLVKGGSSSGSMAGSIDVDGSVTVTGGTIIALGGICETPASGSVNTFISSTTSLSAGSYKLTDSSGNVIAEFTLSASYGPMWIASDAFELNNDYKLLKDGSEVVSWTQSSSIVGSAGNMGGMGGPGGMGGMGGPGGMGGMGGRR